MQHFLLAVSVLMSMGAVSASVAEAGCRCGKSYIADWKTCHKCPCECPSCDYRDCAAPTPTQPGMTRIPQPMSVAEQQPKPMRQGRGSGVYGILLNDDDPWFVRTKIGTFKCEWFGGDMLFWEDDLVLMTSPDSMGWMIGIDGMSKGSKARAWCDPI